MYSPTINKLIATLKKLPSVGQHTAERYIFHWLKSGKSEVNELKIALDALLKNTRSCETCWNFADTNPCPICANTNRDRSMLCVVSEPQAIPALESTGNFKGIYHVLRGTIDSVENEELDSLKINELLLRIKRDKNISEVVLALNPDMSGESTMLFLKNQIQTINKNIKTTRLARGLPMGSDLKYADEITLSNALKNRV